jgi:tetratricopeptide (TPR) repeat protein
MMTYTKQSGIPFARNNTGAVLRRMTHSNSLAPSKPLVNPGDRTVLQSSVTLTRPRGFRMGTFRRTGRRRSIILFGVSVIVMSSLFTALGQTLDAWLVEHFELARQAQRENRLDKAAEGYQQVISHNPKFGGAYLNLGIIYHQQRKYSDAVKALKTAVSLEPELLGAQLILGIDEYMTEDFRGALGHLKKALRLSPQDRQAGVYLGLTYLALDQPLEAVRVLRTMAAYYPADLDIAYQLGEAYLEVVRLGLAELENGGNQSAFYYWGLAIAAKQKGDHVAVVENYMRALGRDPNLAELYWRLAIILRQMEFPDLAATVLARYKLFNPYCSLPQLTKAMTANGESSMNKDVLLQSKPEILRLWEKVPPVRPDNAIPDVGDDFVDRALSRQLTSPEGPAIRVALRLYAQADYNAAVQKINALPVRTGDWVTGFLLASAYTEASDYVNAVRVVEQRLGPYLKVPSVARLVVEIASQMSVTQLNWVLATGANSYPGKMLLAKSYAALGQDEKALSTYEEVLKQFPTRLGIHLAIGQLQENRSHWHEAIEEYKSELALDSANAMAAAHLGHTLTEARQADGAIAVLQKLLETNPTDGVAYADIAKDWELKGETEKAIRAYKEALVYDPSQYTVHYRLFLLYRKVGQEDRSQKELTAFKAAQAQKKKEHQQAMAAFM